MFRVGLVGLGQIGFLYDVDTDAKSQVKTHARALHENPAFDLLFGVDPKRDRRKNFHYLYQTPAFPTLTDALGHHEVDILVISNPTHVHSATVLEALATQKMAAVMCEKPLANSIEEADKIVRTCAASGVEIFVNYVRRTTPGAERMRCFRRELGPQGLPHAQATYTGDLLHSGIHMVDLLEFLLGPITHAKRMQGSSEAGGADAELMLLEHPNGQAVLRKVAEQTNSFSIVLQGSSGYMTFAQSGVDDITWSSFKRGKGLEICHWAEKIGIPFYQRHVYRALEQHLVTGRSTLATGRDGQRHVSMIKALESGGRWPAN